MRLVPAKNHVLVEPISAEDSAFNGVVHTSDGLELFRIRETAELIDENQEIYLKGDTVIMQSGAGYALELNGQYCRLVPQMDILAIWK